MRRLLYGLAALPLLAGVAMAQEPMKLSDQQMDKVTAGWDLRELDISNTSVTLVAIYQRPSNTISCSSCFLLINNPAFSVASAFGP
jgi:hypothetical protein